VTPSSSISVEDKTESYQPEEEDFEETFDQSYKTRVKFQVPMTCQACVDKITKMCQVISHIDSDDFDINLEQKEVTLTHDTDNEKIIQLFGNLGYKVEIIEQKKI